MSESPSTKSKPSIGQRRYNVVLTGHVRKGFVIEQVSIELARLANIGVAQAAQLLSGSARVVKANIDQNTATQFQSRFEAVGAQCAIRPVAAGHSPVEALAAPANAATPALTLRTIKAAFGGEIPPATVTLHYRVAAVAVGVLMILLPVIYATGTIALAFATAWHALNNWDWFLPWPEWGAGYLLLYSALSVAGAVLTLSLLKALVAPVAQTQRPLKLSHQDDPLFFAFVDLIAQRVGAPMPLEINVDCAAAACVRAQHGFIGLSSGQLVLTVGLPLIGGLSARQLAGVLAHDLGQFSPRPGRNFCYAADAVNTWFARAVYGRDAWDGALHEFTQNYNDYRRTLALLAQGAIWVSRKCMLVFVKLGALVSRRLVRHMEFSADRYAACIAGASEFHAATRRIRELHAADDAVSKRLAYNLDEGKLSDNFPKMMIEQSRNLPERYREDIAQAQQQADAHAGELPAHGIFKVDAPGQALLARYERLCRQASLMHYRGVFGIAVKPEQLVSSADAPAPGEQRETDSAGLKNYLGGQFWAARYLHVKRQAAYAAPDAEETKRRLDNLVRQARQGISAYESALAKYKAAYEQRINAAAACVLAQRGIAFDAAAFKLPGCTQNNAAEALQSAMQAAAALEPELLRYESTHAQRLSLALAMRADTETQDDINRLLQALEAVAGAHETIINLRSHSAALTYAVWFPVAAGAGPAYDWRESVPAFQREYTQLLTLAGTAPYPFERKNNVQTAADYLRAYCGKPEQFLESQAQLLKRAENICKCVEFLHERVMARLAFLAAGVEEKLGIEPLKQDRPAAATAAPDPDDIALPF